MPFGAIFGGISGLLGLGSSAASAAGSSAISSAALEKETDAINNGLTNANQVDQNALSTITGNLAPYTTTGSAAETAAGNLAGVNGTAAQNTAFAGFRADPSYQYNVSQGLKAVDQGAASKGMLQSGGTVQAEQTLGNNLANESFGDYYNRISGLATTGLGAQNTLANAGLSTAKDQAGSYTSAASALANINASAAQSQSSALNSGITNGTAALGQIGSSANSLFGMGSSSGSSFSGGGGNVLAGF